MAPAETVLVIRSDGTASLVEWPVPDDARRAVITAQVGAATKMRRCGKGILGFTADRSGVDVPTGVGPMTEPDGLAINEFAAAAFARQGVQLDAALHGPVLFARNPSKGSVVKPLTAAQTANLLVVTGAHIV